jgi:two-component system cell cycle response regulator
VVVAPAELSAARVEDVPRRGVQDVLIEPISAADVIARVRSAARTKTLQEELVGQSRRLETMLHEDPLTGLFNRRYVLTRLAGLISAARRHGRPLSVAMIDIDHFKPLNDEYGHDAGDVALVAITSALRERLRGSVEEVRARCGPHELTATVSVGWATWDSEESADQLVKRADIALYSAKDSGRNAVRGADNASASLPRRT